MVKELFERYLQAFDAHDAAAISSLYTLPCALSDGAGQDVFTDKEPLVARFQQVCTQLQGMGYKGSEFNILKQEAMGPAACAVTVGWKTHFQNSETEYRGLYICHKVEEDWRVFTAHVFAGAFDETTN